MAKRAASPANGGDFSLRDWTCPEVVLRPACPQALEALDASRAEGKGPAAGLCPARVPFAPAFPCQGFPAISASLP